MADRLAASTIVPFGIVRARRLPAAIFVSHAARR